MTNNLFYLLIPILFISCKQKQPDDFFRSLDFKSNAPSQNLKVQPPPPPIALNTIVLPINDNGKKYEIVTENLSGKIIYEENFKGKFSSYPEFLEELSKENFYINANLLNKIYYSAVNKNDSIFSEYYNKGFNFILNKYTLKESSENWGHCFITNPATLSFESENSLLSIMYKQKYLIVLDDYTGHYVFFKNKK